MEQLELFGNEINNNKFKELGQYFTPGWMAQDIVKSTEPYLKRKHIDVLEPAVGEGSFIDALQAALGADNVSISGIEIDSRLKDKLNDKYKNNKNITISMNDFFEVKSNTKSDLIITNPPYIRSQKMNRQEKVYLKKLIMDELGLSVSGYASSYVYFMLHAHSFLNDGGISVWILPGDFLSNNYGHVLREYLENKVNLLRMHMYTFTKSHFDNATVSSLVVIFKKENPIGDILITTGGKMETPEESFEVEKNDLKSSKWLKLFNVGKRIDASGRRFGDFVDIKRGIATGNNTFFIKNLPDSIVKNDKLSIPVYDPKLIGDDNVITNDNVRVFKHVLYTNLSREKINHEYPVLSEYLKLGEERDVDKKYITSHRKIWYQQEYRKSPDYIFGNIFNIKSLEKAKFVKVEANRVIATNSFLLIYLKPEFKEMKDMIFKKISNVTNDQFLEIGRVYGGGMVKIEPKELLELLI